MENKEENKDIQEIELVIPCIPDYVGVVRLAISGIATRLNLPVEEIEDLKLAVSEACSNAVQYAHDTQRETQKVWVFFKIYPEKLQIQVVDKGKGFDMNAVKESNKDKDESVDSSLGLGITFIKSLMDTVEFKSDDQGTTVTMVKYF